jgi:DNA-binding response OmpR family regulator
MVKPINRVLYFEDEQDMVDLVRLVLSREGYTVEGASEGRAGLAAIREFSPDIILLDLMMPDMDGWEIYRQLKKDEDTKDIPVIIVTAKAKSIDKVLGSEVEKVDDYIIKPFSPRDLVERVSGVLSECNESGEDYKTVNSP